MDILYALAGLAGFLAGVVAQRFLGLYSMVAGVLNKDGPPPAPPPQK